MHIIPFHPPQPPISISFSTVNLKVVGEWLGERLGERGGLDYSDIRSNLLGSLARVPCSTRILPLPGFPDPMAGFKFRRCKIRRIYYTRYISHISPHTPRWLGPVSIIFVFLLYDSGLSSAYFWISIPSFQLRVRGIIEGTTPRQ